MVVNKISLLNKQISFTRRPEEYNRKVGEVVIPLPPTIDSFVKVNK